MAPAWQGLLCLQGLLLLMLLPLYILFKLLLLLTCEACRSVSLVSTD